jgi:NADH dehydrogenase (ubiquinone) 1 alpha subcomplex subunit 1
LQIPPFAIIVGAITAMGGLQSLSQTLTMGKPKAIATDHWDRQLEFRDRQVSRHADEYAAAWQVM